jgi:hypothetical protein
MTANFTTNNDFAAITDGLESVTLLRRESLTEPGETISYALRRTIDTAEVIGDNRKTIESDGRYTATDTVWNLSIDQLTDAPRLGDVLQDAAGCRWTILEVRLVLFRSRWRCHTRALSIAYGLEDLIDILQAEYTQSESGVTETTWTVLQAGVRGRIQPIETKIIDDQSTRKSVHRCRIILEESFDLDHTHRLRGPDGTLYRLTSVAGFPKLGELQTIDVEKIEASELLDFLSDVSLPEVPANTFLTYETDRDAQTVHVSGDSLALPGDLTASNSAAPVVVGQTPAIFPTTAMGDVILPVTIHRLTWRRVTRPPWTAIRECQGMLNDSAFLGVPAGQLLFDGVKTTRELLDLPDGNPQLVWRLDYRFREKPLLLNAPSPLFGTSDFSRLLMFEKSD